MYECSKRNGTAKLSKTMETTLSGVSHSNVYRDCPNITDLPNGFVLQCRPIIHLYGFEPICLEKFFVRMVPLCTSAEDTLDGVYFVSHETDRNRDPVVPLVEKELIFSFLRQRNLTVRDFEILQKSFNAFLVLRKNYIIV